jgi:uncharacterized protein (TIGR00255 family)
MPKDSNAPLASMTGFARALGQQGGWQWTWEIKSVNARSLDVRMRLPSGNDRLEMAAREAAAKRFKRGSLNFNLALNRSDADSAASSMQVNSDFLDELVETAQRYQGRVASDPPRIEALLAVRGVVEPVEAQETEEAFTNRVKAMLESLGEALAALAEAREEEGARLKVVLMDQLAALDALCADASEADGARPDKVMERMRTALDALLEASPALSEERLAQEVAVMVAKGDIREELDRLAAHIAAARELLEEGGPCGRRLDFLCQELTREANTLCSKSGDVDLTRVGLAMKAAIEQFREQVQNLE